MLVIRYAVCSTYRSNSLFFDVSTYLSPCTVLTSARSSIVLRAMPD